MKKRLLSFFVMIMIAISCAGCVSAYQEATTKDIGQDLLSGYFTNTTEWGVGYQIVYANDTKVKYLILYDAYRFGITPLYNADGTLQVYYGY